MNAACVVYLNDWLRARENKRSETEMKRGMISPRENRKVEGRYFLDRMTRKNRSIKRMKENKRKAMSQEGKLTIGSAKGGEIGKKYRLR
jgi:hypothetical protein